MNLEIAKTIKNQIGLNTHMACGSRNFSAGDNYLAFRVGSSKIKQWIKIKLNEKDLYDVECLKQNIKTGELKTIEKYEDVFCDMLDGMIYRIVNK